MPTSGGEFCLAFVVHLQKNYIQSLEEGNFVGLELCSELDLSSNAISVISPRAFIGLTRLQILRLGNNRLTELDQTMWTGLLYLQILGLTGNGITTISSGAFCDMRSLTNLYLAKNNLSIVNGNMWLGLQSLETLDLNGNHLTDIPHHGLANMPSLEKLVLSSNRLRTLRVDAFNPDDYLDYRVHPPYLELHLQRNPLQCDGNPCWLKAAMESGSVHAPCCLTCADVGTNFKHVALNCTPGKNYY